MASIFERLKGNWLQSWEKASTHHDKQVDHLYKNFGIERTSSPRELATMLAEAFRDAVEIRMSVDAEEIYLMGLSDYQIPDSWGQILEMMEAKANLAGKASIEVIAPPKGSIPDVASVWVGKTIPFSEQIQAPLIFGNHQLAKAGMVSKDDKFYSVLSQDAMAQLNESEESFILSHYPYWKDSNLTLIFDSDAVRIVKPEQDSV